MIDWPVASILLGLLVPITVALIKLVPTRNGAAARGADLLARTEVAVLKTKMEALGAEINHLREELRDLWQRLDKLRSAIAEPRQREPQ